MLNYVIIADDLSGACDTAVQFSNFGYRTIVINKLANLPARDAGFNAVAITTNSRDASAADAQLKIKEVCKSLKSLPDINIYKKIDSTWRGNIGAELETLLRELDLKFVVICSAYPRNKRVGLGGYLLVDGQLLHHTSMAKDPGSPIKEGFLPDLLQKQTRLPVKLITLKVIEKGVEILKEYILSNIKDGPCLFIADTIEESHLDILAQLSDEGLPRHIYVGSAGLSAAILRQDKEKGEAAEALPVLTVIGSVHPNSNLQVDEMIKKYGVKEIYIPWPNLLHYSEGALKDFTKEALTTLQGGADLVIRTSRTASDVELAKAEAERLGLSSLEIANTISLGLQKFMAGILGYVELAGIMVTGGATALQLLEVMNAEGIEVEREIEAGVPLGKIVGGTLNNLPIITKAGGFGSRNIFCNGVEILKQRERSF
ncbi:MAG: four-carbon acid sugar kinase family protein [Peptococcaceae bacterium]